MFLFKGLCQPAVLGGLLLLLATPRVSGSGGGSISKQPDSKINKAKIQMLQAYAPIMKPDSSTSTGLTKWEVDEDGLCPVGEPDANGQYCTGKVHPLVAVYMEEEQSGAASSNTELNPQISFDIHAAVSLDEGNTWKRRNLSRSASKSKTHNSGHCFTSHSQDDGDHENRRFLHEDGGGEDGGTDPAGEDFDYAGTAFKPMVIAKGKDILVAWTSKQCNGGVPGEGGLPFQETDEGEDKYFLNGRHNCYDYTGQVEELGRVPFSCVWAARGVVDTQTGETVWRKPERITSGRRDAFQLFAQATGSGDTAAWALVWQEDPKGLRPGEQSGPGEGMSGATVNHKTDIWYTYLHGHDFEAVTDCGDSNITCVETRFEPPVRITDNASCKWDGQAWKGAPYCKGMCDSNHTYEEPGNATGNPEKNYPSCITPDGLILKGDTGASRPNMFLVPEAGSARVLLVYEETKGLGHGGDKTNSTEEREDWGKNAFYHTFMFDQPDEIKHGTRLNLPETTGHSDGKPLQTEDGRDFLTNNARRVKIIAQSKGSMGEGKTAAVALWREGPNGHGQPADIHMRRFVGGYMPENLQCKKYHNMPNGGGKVCVTGDKNLNYDQPPEDEESRRDSRAHRGFIRGDFLVLGYTSTSKFGRGLMGKPYDLFIRRSFDGGETFTNINKEEEPGGINLSNLRTGDADGNGGWSVMEPRIVPTPGSIGKPPKYPSDAQNQMVFFVAYCTTHKPDQRRSLEGMPIGSDIPKDIYWTWTDNYGESYNKQWNDIANKWEYPWFAKVSAGAGPEAGMYGAPQIKVTPAGNKLFASFEGEVGGSVTTDGGGPCRGSGSGSDVCFESSTALNNFLRYDVSNDKRVNSDDLDEINAVAASGTPLSDEKYDLNKDGELAADDVWLMRRAILEFQKHCAVENPVCINGMNCTPVATEPPDPEPTSAPTETNPPEETERTCADFRCDTRLHMIRVHKTVTLFNKRFCFSHCWFARMISIKRALGWRCGGC